MKTAIFLIVAALAFPFTVPAAMGQVTSGGLRGVVRDDTGAVIPDATVRLTNDASGASFEVRTNAEGVYRIPSLNPGIYTLIVEAPGFKRQTVTQINVLAGQESSLDVAMSAGLESETVTVTAEGQELIQKDQVQVSSSFESRQVAELPSNIAGGGIDTLALLAPGVVPGFGNVNNNGSTLSVNGQRARSNNFTIDGQDNNDLSIGGPSFFVGNQDVVAEFQVITSNFSAEYGRNQGAIVNIVTKSGTNEWNGTASWFHRDRRKFDALTNIERRAGQEDPQPFLYNVYTGTLGGPIIKDRAWVFGSYQLVTGRALALARSGNPTIAPEELGRLSADFPNNPAIQALANFSAFALSGFGNLSERPDRPGGFITIGGNTYRTAFPQREFGTPFDQHDFTVRGDVKLTDNHSIWYRHAYQTVDNINALGGSNGFTGNVPADTNFGGAAWTWQVSNTAVNEVRFSFNRLSVIFGSGCEGFAGCIPHPDDIGSTYTNIAFSGVRDSTGANLQTIGPATNLPQGRTVTSYQIQDNFSKTIGRHQMKMGADIRRLTNNAPFLPNVNGAFLFNSITSLAQNRPARVNLAAGTVAISYNETDQFYYFQDDWRIRDNLTLNLGIRYEYIGQPINTLHELSLERESNPSTSLWLQSLPLEARTFPKLPADKNNWAPRLGFAWSPRFGDGAFSRFLFGENDQTVISGGYSIAYDPPFYNIMLNISTSSPLVFLNTTLNPAAPAPVAFPLPADATGAGVQAFASGAGLIAFNTFDPRFFSQTVVSPDFYNPYVQQWTLRWQREVARNNVFEARYVGNRATGLFMTLNRNPRVDRLINGFTLNVPGLGPTVFPGFPNLVPQGTTFHVAGQGPCVDNPATTTLNEAAQCAGRVLPQGLVRSRENTAFSTYHGLQTRYQARVLDQLSFGLSYTFSKALDNASEIFSFQESAAPQDPFNITAGNKGFSGFDRRHAMSLNWVWDIPGFRSQEGVLGRILGGWQLNGTYFLANGLRYTPSQFINSNVLGGASYFDTTWEGSFIGFDSGRPFVGNLSAPRTEIGISQIDASLIDPFFFGLGLTVSDPNGIWLLNDLYEGRVTPVSRDQVRYILNGPGAARIFGSPYGDALRNSEMGPRLNNMNLGLFKNIRVREGWRLQFRAEVFNALNHKNPGVGFNAGDAVPDFFIEDAGLQDGYADFTGMTGARRAWQLGLKLIF